MTERQLIVGADAIMDTRVLREFLAMVGPAGPELLRNIADVYIVETPPVLTALGMALQRGDSRSAARLAHRLKGSCLSIGASGLAASCEAVEAACEAGAPPGVETYHELRLCFDATTNALHEFLGGLPG